MVENPNRKVEKLLPEERLGGNGLFARITVFPGREIDYHEHHGETETYHIIAGEGVYGDNGAERAIYAETGSLTDRKKPAKSYDFADFLQRTVKIDIFVFGVKGSTAYKTGPSYWMPVSCAGLIFSSGKSFRHHTLSLSIKYETTSTYCFKKDLRNMRFPA